MEDLENIKDIMLSEISQSKKDKLYDSIYEVQVVKIIKIESIMMVAKGCGERRMGGLFNGYRVSVLQDEKSHRNGWW